MESEISFTRLFHPMPGYAYAMVFFRCFRKGRLILFPCMESD
jgi:hypothetical protein